MDSSLGSRSFLAGAALVALVTAVAGAWIALRIGGARATLWVDDGLTPLAALLACALCARARARHEGRMRLFWSLLACATGLWTLAEIVWGYYALILDVEVPVPSWADVGYLSAIPFAVAALVAHPATGGGGTRRARSLFDGLLVATALTFLSWTLVLAPLWRSADLSTWAGVVTLAYPFGDVVIVFFIVLAIRGMTGAQRLSLWCLLAALLVMALSDSTYTYLAEVSNYTSGDPIDVGWIAAYLGIALAAFGSGSGSAVAPGVVGVGAWSAERSRPSLASLISPLLPVLLALSVAAVELGLGHRLDRAGWLMAFALIALVLVRQTLMVLELLAPGRHARADLLHRLTDAAVGGAGVGEGPGSGR
ncbi:MAG: hypothetical protein ACLPUT_07470 [Solirubrobacteraceae bacterium]